MSEPQSAVNYDHRTAAAVKAVLVEIGQILGSFRGKFAAVGGAPATSIRRTLPRTICSRRFVDFQFDPVAFEEAKIRQGLIAVRFQTIVGRNQLIDLQRQF